MVKNTQTTAPKLIVRPLGFTFECGLTTELRQSTDPDYQRLVAELSGVHRLDFFVWLYCLKGKSTQIIDFNEYYLEQGQAIFVRPNELRKSIHSDDFEGFVISWRDEFLLKSIGYQKLPTLQTFEIQEQQQLSSFFDLLRFGVNYYEKPLKINYLQNQFSAFLYFLTHKFQSNAPKSEQNQRYQQFIGLLESHFTISHQVKYYADLLACSPKTLNLTCQQHSTMTAKSLINKRILLEAKRLLVHTNLSANQIGKQLGFSESTNFAKFFKQNEGKTPAEFREIFSLYR